MLDENWNTKLIDFGDAKCLSQPESEADEEDSDGIKTDEDEEEKENDKIEEDDGGLEFEKSEENEMEKKKDKYYNRVR